MMSIHGVRHQAGAGILGDSPRLIFVMKNTKVTFDPVDRNRGLPHTSHFVPVNAAPSRRRARFSTSILTIGGSRNSSQIAASTVQSVAVDVVSIQTIPSLQSKNLSVQFDSVLAAGPVWLVAPSVSFRVKKPSPLAELLSVVCVNQGVGSDGTIASAQRDACGNSIVIPQNRGRALSEVFEVAGIRAVCPVSSRGRANKVTAARQAGKMNGHRLSPSGGVLRPGVASNNAGLFVREL